MDRFNGLLIKREKAKEFNHEHGIILNGLFKISSQSQFTIVEWTNSQSDVIN